MAHPLNSEEDNVTLEKCSNLFSFIDSQKLIEMNIAFCGGLGTEALSRLYIDKDRAEPIQPDDLVDAVNSHDADFRGDRTFYHALIYGYPQVVYQSPDEHDKIEKTKMTVREFMIHEPNDPKQEMKIEIIDRLQYLDDEKVPPYQGIAAIEKPLGEDGPRVKTLDPLSLMIVKASVSEALDSDAKYTGNKSFKEHCEAKSKKYKWHMRRLALTIPTYLEIARERYLKGEIPNDPAIIARRLLKESVFKDYVYFPILGEKPTMAIRDFCRKFSGENERTIYTADDFRGREIG